MIVASVFMGALRLCLQSSHEWLHGAEAGAHDCSQSVQVVVCVHVGGLRGSSHALNQAIGEVGGSLFPSQWAVSDVCDAVTGLQGGA